MGGPPQGYHPLCCLQILVSQGGETSKHVDCLEWEKGREVSFNSASLFFTKVASGNVGVMRSRDLKVLQLDSFIELYCFCAEPGDFWLVDEDRLLPYQDWKLEHCRQLLVLFRLGWLLLVQRRDGPVYEDLCRSAESWFQASIVNIT